MISKYEGDKRGASQQQQVKPLTNSRLQHTPTSTEQNPGQFKAKPAPSSTTKDVGQTQKQTKAQQNQAKQAQKQENKQAQKYDNKQSTPKQTANDAKHTATTSTKEAKKSTKDAKQTVEKKDHFKSQPGNDPIKSRQANKNTSVSTATKNDPWKSSSTRKAW